MGFLRVSEELDVRQTRSAKTKQIVISVKAGKLHAPYVRDLRGVVEREQAALGALLTLNAPTKAMRTEAASAGFYASPWGPYGATKRPRLANRRNKVGASGCSRSSLRECPTLCASSYSRPLAG